MKIELQNIAWNSLPKEVRRAIKNEYEYSECGSYMEDFLEKTFGTHNLSSDIEPEEMLMVERKEVRKHYQEAEMYASNLDKENWDNRIQANAIKSVLKDIFGDKCMPDSLIPSNSGELKKETVDNKPVPKLDIGIEKTITFLSKLSLGDRLYYNNPDGDSNYDIFEIEITALKVRMTSKGVNEIIYECRTPFQDYHVTLLGDSDRRIYKDLQEVANYKNTYSPSIIKHLDGSTLLACVDIGIKDKIEGEWKVIIPCQLSKKERLNSKRSLH